ncbi:MAG: DUF2332 family protein, partial [Pseudomonadota bacterium]
PMSKLAEAFQGQAQSCAHLGSPFMDQLMQLLAGKLDHGGPVMERMRAWPGDVSSRGASLPLRLAGGLHALVLTRKAPELVAIYPPTKVDDDTLWQGISDAITTHSKFLLDWLERPPQTNEVRRSVVLIPAARLVAQRFGLPLSLSELGASAGLNLNFDQFALEIAGHRFGPCDAALTLTPDWTGPLPAGDMPYAVERRGCDLTPVTGADAALRLRAYLWPDQPERAALLEAALGCPPTPVDAEDAQSWLADRLDADAAGRCHMIYHTVAWQYFPEEVQSRCRAMIEAAGARATDQSPLAWFGMEADTEQNGAALRLRMWPGDINLTLGRADFHGRWVIWDPQES